MESLAQIKCVLFVFFFGHKAKLGSGKMLLERIIEKNKIDAYFSAGKVIKRLALPHWVRIGPHKVRAPRRG